MRIIDASFTRSVTEIGQRKQIALPEVCFIGRSNVGKSSLLNTLAGRKIARTGGTPGVTRLINLYTIAWERGGRRGAPFSRISPVSATQKSHKGCMKAGRRWSKAT